MQVKVKIIHGLFRHECYLLSIGSKHAWNARGVDPLRLPPMKCICFHQYHFLLSRSSWKKSTQAGGTLILHKTTKKKDEKKGQSNERKEKKKVLINIP